MLSTVRRSVRLFRRSCRIRLVRSRRKARPKFFLENNGYVAGVAWTDDYKNAKYELIHEYKELYRITQTKYFQPEMSEIFVQIKEKLDKGSKVLFIGTSCSNAGLKSFLNREYNNLYCCCLLYTS